MLNEEDPSRKLYVCLDPEVPSGQGSIQVAAGKEGALELSLDDSMTISEWVESGMWCHIKTADGGYFGYNKESGFAEYFLSTDKAGAGRFRAEKWVEKSSKPSLRELNPSPEETNWSKSSLREHKWSLSLEEPKHPKSSERRGLWPGFNPSLWEPESYLWDESGPPNEPSVRCPTPPDPPDLPDW